MLDLCENLQVYVTQPPLTDFWGVHNFFKAFPTQDLFDVIEFPWNSLMFCALATQKQSGVPYPHPWDSVALSDPAPKDSCRIFMIVSVFAIPCLQGFRFDFHCFHNVCPTPPWGALFDLHENLEVCTPHPAGVPLRSSWFFRCLWYYSSRNSWWTSMIFSELPVCNP